MGKLCEDTVPLTREAWADAAASILAQEGAVARSLPPVPTACVPAVPAIAPASPVSARGAASTSRSRTAATRSDELFTAVDAHSASAFAPETITAASPSAKGASDTVVRAGERARVASVVDGDVFYLDAEPHGGMTVLVQCVPRCSGLSARCLML